MNPGRVSLQSPVTFSARPCMPRFATAIDGFFHELSCAGSQTRKNNGHCRAEIPTSVKPFHERWLTLLLMQFLVGFPEVPLGNRVRNSASSLSCNGSLDF